MSREGEERPKEGKWEGLKEKERKKETDTNRFKR